MADEIMIQADLQNGIMEEGGMVNTTDDDLAVMSGLNNDEESNVIRFDENESPMLGDEFRQLRGQRNFGVFRERYISRMKDQLIGLEEVLRAQKNEHHLMEQEDEQNADWMWDVQRNYAKLEKEMSELDSTRLQLKSELMKSDEAHVYALRALNKEEKYIRELELNETRNQQEIHKLDEYYHTHYRNKEEAYINAKIVDSGITRQKKDLNLTKLQKRHHDFEIYRLQRQITAAEERSELRRAIKKQRTDDLANLKKQKMEATADLEVLKSQSEQITRSVEYDMRSLEDNNLAAAELAIQVKLSTDTYKGILADTNGYKKDIRVLQARHEQLTHITLRSTRELNNQEKKIEFYQQDIEKLYDQYNQTNRLAKVLTDKNDSLQRFQKQKEVDLQGIRDKLSIEIKRKQDADVAFHEALMENKAFLKAARFALDEYRKLNEKLHAIEEDIGQRDHEISQQAIFRIEALKEFEVKKVELAKLAKEVKEKESELKEAMANVERESTNIDRRQDKINRLTIRVDELIAAAGGEEISPVEVQITEHKQAIQEGEELFRQLNNDWLRYQNSIVHLTEKRDRLHALATDFDNQAFIAVYKLNRLNKEVAAVEAECAEYARTEKMIQENIAKSSEQLFKFNQKERELVLQSLDLEHASLGNMHKEEILLEGDQAALENCVEQLTGIEEEIYSTKECTLMWEKKLELKKLARQAIQKDFSKRELEELRNEVHKLELDKGTLEREQVKVTQEMLFAAERRDQLHTFARRRAIEGEGPSVKKAEQIIERKSRDVQALQKELKAVTVLEEDCRQRLDVFQKQVEEQTTTANELEGSWEKATKEKDKVLKQRFHIRLHNFIAQQYGKNYLAIKSKTYVAHRLRGKNAAEVKATADDLKQKYVSLLKVVDRTGEHFPGLYDDRKSQSPLLRKA